MALLRLFRKQLVRYYSKREERQDLAAPPHTAANAQKAAPLDADRAWSDTASQKQSTIDSLQTIAAFNTIYTLIRF